MAFTIAVIGFVLIIGGCFAGFFFKDFLLEDINGVICSFERLYFDIMEGQINLNTPKWPGLEKMPDKLTTLHSVLKAISNQRNYQPKPSLDQKWIQNTNNNNRIEYRKYNQAMNSFIGVSEINSSHNFIYLDYRGTSTSYSDTSTYLGLINQEVFDAFNTYYNDLSFLTTLVQSCPSVSNLSTRLLTSINDVTSFQSSFSGFKGNVLDDIDDYQGYVEDYGDPALIAIFSVLLGFAIIGLFSLFFYVLSKNQTPSRIILHFVWNFSTFFTFLSLLLGGTFGIVNMAGKDGIGFMMYIFGEENLNLNNNDPKLIPAGEAQDYLHYCLYDTQDLADKFSLSNDLATSTLNSIFNSTLIITENQKKLNSLMTLKSIESIKVSISNYQADVLLSVTGNTLQNDFDNVNTELLSHNMYIVSNKNRCSSSQYELLLPNQSLTNNKKIGCIDINDWSETQIVQLNILDATNQVNLKNIYSYFNDNQKTTNELLKCLDTIQNEFINGMTDLNNTYISLVAQDFGDLVTEFQSISKSGNVLSFLNCKFMENYLNIVYETFSDLSDSAKYLCIILLCVSFVEIITIYCVMLSIFRFDNRIQIHHHNISYLSEKEKMNKEEEAEPIKKDTEANEKLTEPQKPTTESIQPKN